VIRKPWTSTHTLTRQQRGYGASWVRVRAKVLKRDAHLCQCRHCKAEGLVRPASEVDHIVPKFKGGTDDESNLQAINRECHERKSLEDAGSREPIRFRPDGLPIWAEELN